ncbi:sperm acrosome membrane-associated protein 6 isoform X1 [Scyliorhinus canicula]|uniref:sperm acrosome membrane-associated protein 6 isoform X1 n=2 Tax=Scyliorhinus canicula TaxID=7830 RepID=UPI0018F61450|nr:sperm acrosome membrane-associated protein 6 isoform X1 [Scyliorhinus canicula]
MPSTGQSVLLRLLLLLASALGSTLCCYACFAKSSEKFCTEYMGQDLIELHHAHCWHPINELINKRQVYWLRIAQTEYKKLKSIYKKALNFIKKRRRLMPAESYASLLDKVEQEVLHKVYRLKEATPCNYTCGINMASFYFDCHTCKMKGCEGISFECPIKDVTVKETGQVSMKCQSNFTIPKIDTVTWMYASHIRTDVIAQFKILNIGDDITLSIHNVKMKNAGTYACDVTKKKIILLRRFFYLIVSRSTLQGSIDLQRMFQNVLQEKRTTLRTPTARPIPPPDKRSDTQTETQLIVAIAMGTLLMALVAIVIYRWATKSK